jgi:hypothetical protein
METNTHSDPLLPPLSASQEIKHEIVNYSRKQTTKKIEEEEKRLKKKKTCEQLPPPLFPSSFRPPARPSSHQWASYSILLDRCGWMDETNRTNTKKKKIIFFSFVSA